MTASSGAGECPLVVGEGSGAGAGEWTLVVVEGCRCGGRGVVYRSSAEEEGPLSGHGATCCPLRG